MKPNILVFKTNQKRCKIDRKELKCILGREKKQREDEIRSDSKWLSCSSQCFPLCQRDL